MKRLVYILVLVLVSFGLKAQTQPSGIPSPRSDSGFAQYNWIRLTKGGMIYPSRDTLFTPTYIGTTIYWANPVGDSSLWIYQKTTGRKWAKVVTVNSSTSPGTGTVTSIATNDGTGITGGTITSTGTLVIDTSSIISTKANVTALVNPKLNISDTAAMLSNLLKISDTVTMLSGYAKTGNVVPNTRTISTNAPLAGGGALSSDLTLVADTGRANAQLVSGGSLNKVRDSLQANITASVAGVSSVSTTNNYGISSSVATPTTTPNISIGVDTLLIVPYTDTLKINGIATKTDIINAATGGTVTSIATTNGILGGTITTTGTLQVDSSAYSTKANVTALLLAKLNLSDTSTMLNPYLRKTDTSTMLLPYLRKTDTATMLSGYTRLTRFTDTTAVLRALINTKGTGTVTSVALSLPSFITVSGSPITTSGTLTGTLANQTANKVFASATSGSPAQPTFRALVAADIPDLSGTYIKNQTTQQVSSNFNIDGTGIANQLTSNTNVKSIAQGSGDSYLFRGTKSDGITDIATLNQSGTGDGALSLSNTSGVQKILFNAGGVNFINSGYPLLINKTIDDSLHHWLQVTGTAYADTLASSTTISSMVKSDAGGHLISAISGIDYLSPSDSLSGGYTTWLLTKKKIDSLAYALSGTGYVPYTGAIDSVDLGNYNLTVYGITIGRGAGNVPQNTVIGRSALTQNTFGAQNVALGLSALQYNIIGNNNSGLGTYSLMNNLGSFNTGAGAYSLIKNTTGAENTSIGYNTLKDVTDGSSNTSVGNKSGSGVIHGSNNTFLGANIGSAIPLDSMMNNHVIISTGDGVSKLLYDSTKWLSSSIINYNSNNYSSLFTDSTLVTKKYVDSAISGNYIINQYGSSLVAQTAKMLINDTLGTLGVVIGDKGIFSTIGATGGTTNLDGEYHLLNNRKIYTTNNAGSTFSSVLYQGTNDTIYVGNQTNYTVGNFKAFNNGSFRYIAPNGSGTLALTSDIPDTTSLSNRINFKLNISDTASMLSNYAKKFKNNATAFVDTFGNNATARLGRSDLPFKTINAALDSLGTNGGVISLGYGTFDAPDSSKIHSNLWFKGSGKPVPNWNIQVVSNDSVYISTPTKLIGGTIINGTMWFEKKATLTGNIVITNLGIDVGKDWADNYNSGAGVDGLMVCQYFNLGGGQSGADGVHPLQADSPPLTGVVINNVISLLANDTTLRHANLIENVIDPYVSNLTSVLGNHGTVIKSIGGVFNNLESYGNSGEGLDIKSNDYANCQDVNIVNYQYRAITGGTNGYAILLHGAEYPLRRIKVSNWSAFGPAVGIGVSNTSAITDCVINGFTIYKSSGNGIDITGNSFTNNVISNFVIDSAKGKGFYLNTSGIDNNFISNGISKNNLSDGFNINASLHNYANNLTGISNGGYDINYGTNVVANNINGSTFNGTTSTNISGFSGADFAGPVDVHGILYTRNDIYSLNKAGSGWVIIGSRDTSASETVMNLTNIGSITASNDIYTTSGDIKTNNGALRSNSSTGGRIQFYYGGLMDYEIGEGSGDGSRNLNIYNANTGAIPVSINRVTDNVSIKENASLKHLIGSSSAPSISAGAGAGTSPTVSISGTDMAGEITVITGSSPSTASVLCTITFSSAYSTAPYVVFSPSNQLTAQIVANQGVYVNSSTGSFTLNTNTVALTGASTYKWTYHVMQ